MTFKHILGCGDDSNWQQSHFDSTSYQDSEARLMADATYVDGHLTVFPQVDDFPLNRTTEYSYAGHATVPMFLDTSNMYLDLDSSTVHHVGEYLGLTMPSFPNELDPFLRPMPQEVDQCQSFTSIRRLLPDEEDEQFSFSSSSRRPSADPPGQSSLPQSRRASSLSKSVTDSGRSGSVSSSTPTSDCGTPGNKSMQALTTKWKPEFQPRSCPYKGCNCKVVFTRTCDFRKHYNRHFKHLFCRVAGCPQSEGGALSRNDPSESTPSQGCFSNKKDRARHEARHNPTIRCEWTDPLGERCPRVFSRIDNMKDHMKRVHRQRKFLKPLEMELRPRPPLADISDAA